MKKVAVIGAGKFGMTLTKFLCESGVEVLLIDRNGALIQDASKTVSYAVTCDATNPRALEATGIKECDIAVVTIGTNVESSTLVTMLCKEMGIKTVVSRASGELHEKILQKIGADRVVVPYHDSARRLARSIMNYDGFDLFEISEGLSVAEIKPPLFTIGKTLAESNIRKRYGVTVLCIRRVGESEKKPRSVIVPDAGDVVRGDDKLIVFGRPQQIDDMAKEK